MILTGILPLGDSQTVSQGCRRGKAQLRENPLHVVVSRPPCQCLLAGISVSTALWMSSQVAWVSPGWAAASLRASDSRWSVGAGAFTITSAMFYLSHRLIIGTAWEGTRQGGGPWGLSWRLPPWAHSYNGAGSFDNFSKYRNRCFSILLALNSNFLFSNMALIILHYHNWIIIGRIIRRFYFGGKKSTASI